MEAVHFNEHFIPSLVFIRLLQVKRENLFNAWIDEKQVAAWWGPRGFKNPICKIDPKPQGNILIEMRAPDGMVFPVTGVFHKITEPGELVFTTRAFDDNEGNPQLEVMNEVNFREENGRTRLMLKATVVKSLTEMDAAIEGMQEGWTQSLDKLEQYLSNDI